MPLTLRPSWGFVPLRGFTSADRKVGFGAVQGLMSLFVAGNLFSRMRQDTMVTTAMQDIQMPGPMKIDLELV